MLKICVALDVDREKALALVERLSTFPLVFKVGPKLFMDSGKEIVGKIKSSGREIFLDLKLHDIPNTVRLSVEKAEELGVDYLTIHTLGGREMLEWALRGRKRVKLIGVTLLTSHGEEYLKFLKTEFRSIRDMVLYLSTVAKEAGLDGVVCSGKEVEEVKKNTGLFTVVPGIRLLQKREDQVRVLTPQEAAKKGADMIVMGREIYRSEEPEKVIREVLERIGG